MPPTASTPGRTCEPIEQALEELRSLRRLSIARARNRDLHRDDPRRIEARVHVEEIHEAANEQAGACQQHQREGHFDHDERAAGPVAASATAGAAALLERRRQRPARGASMPGRSRRARRSATPLPTVNIENRAVDADGLQALHRQALGDDCTEQPDAPPGKEQSGDAAGAATGSGFLRRAGE